MTGQVDKNPSGPSRRPTGFSLPDG